MNVIDLAELELLPDWAIRLGIRGLLARRMREQRRRGDSQIRADKQAFVEQIRLGPLAEATDLANKQHYEVPSEFFRLVLGPRLKYSCCWYNSPDVELGVAEAQMLKLTCQRAALADGQHILELGCGWGSLTLWMAEHFPASRITAVSNSHSQREFIAAAARERGLTNIRLVTADMRDLQFDETFDRIVSVEMFEHLRNYELLLSRLASWLEADGRLFVHIFCHRETPYLFETTGTVNWMGRHFFTGGMMPSADLLSHFDEHLVVTENWRVSGLHYARTCEAWLNRLDQRRGQVLQVFRKQLGPGAARVAVQRWRMFFMACAELFRYREGNEWFVGHYLLAPTGRRSTVSRTQSLVAGG